MRGRRRAIPDNGIVQDSTEPARPSAVLSHGGRVLPAVTVDTYNEELRDEDGFVGDRASGRAFRAILEDWRDKLRAQGEDPFGDTPTREISKSKLDKVLAEGDPLAAGLVHTAVEEFAVELATVVRRFLRLKDWHGTERIVVGGGLSASHIGELAMGRAAVLLAGENIAVELKTISNHPDKAGLIGAVQLAPSWVLAGHDAILAADIGGTNVRVGVVDLKMKKKGDVSKAAVWKQLHWRHRDDEPTREQALERIAEDGQGADRSRDGREAEAGAIRRRRLSRPDRRARRDRERRPEPAGQLGGRGLQPGPRADAPPAAAGRARARGRHAQRRGGPGPERGART